jgi:hypothetical protein
VAFTTASPTETAETDVFNDSSVDNQDISASTVQDHLPSNINQFEEQASSLFVSYEFVQNINPTFSGIIVHGNFRLVIFFLTHVQVIKML